MVGDLGGRVEVISLKWLIDESKPLGLGLGAIVVISINE